MAAPSNKIFSIENIRIFLVSLVVSHHLACAYSDLGQWYYQEPTAYYPLSVLLITFTAINQSFFMALFFFISAYFIPVSLDRKGLPAYLGARLMRLGIPLIVFYFVISPATKFMVAKFAYGTRDSLWAYLASLDGKSFGPLWFVEALLIFTLIYILGRQLHNKISSSQRPAAQTTPPRDTTLLFWALAIGLLSAAVRVWMPVGRVVVPFEFQLSHFLQYILLFSAGIVAGRNSWVAAISYRRGWRWMTAALVLIFVAAPMILLFGGGFSSSLKPFFGGWHWQSLAYAIWEQLLGVSLIMGLLGLFNRKLNYQPDWIKSLSDGAYAVFIIHAPILVVLNLSIRHLALDSFFKAIILVPFALAACFSLALVLKKIPLINKVI